MTDREKLIQEIESGEKSVRELIKGSMQILMNVFIDSATKSDEELKEMFLDIMKNSGEDGSNEEA